MVERLDNVVDEIKHMSILIVELGLDDLPSAVELAAEVLYHMSQSIEKAFKHVKIPKKMETHLFDAN